MRNPFRAEAAGERFIAMGDWVWMADASGVLCSAPAPSRAQGLSATLSARVATLLGRVRDLEGQVMGRLGGRVVGCKRFGRLG